MNKDGKLSPELLKEYLKVRPDRAQLIENFLNMTPPRIIRGATRFPESPEKLLGLIDSSIKRKLGQEIDDAQNPSVNLKLNPPNTDQQQKEAPVVIEGITEKQPPSVNLQLNDVSEAQTPEPVQNQAVDKQQLLQSNPWLLEVNNKTKYYDFNKYANSKRREGSNFDTSEKWQIFKKYYDRP